MFETRDEDEGSSHDVSKEDENCSSFPTDDIIPATPEVPKAKKRKMEWMCSGGPHIPKAESAFYMNLKNPVCPSITKTYVYHSFRNLLKYDSKNYPENNYVKIIGQYEISRGNIPYVQGFDYNDREFTIFLNMRMLEKLPKSNEVVEIFGQLDFRKVMNKDVPIVVVHFFSPMDGDILQYAYCLNKLSKFVPESCLKPKEEAENYQSSLLDDLQDLSFTIISMDQ